MQGKGIYIILLGIIAVLTLTVAVLSIFLFVTFNQAVTPATASSESAAAASGEPAGVPADQLKTWNPFATKENADASAIIDLKPSEAHEDSYAQVNLLLKYDVGEKRANEEAYTILVETDAAAEIQQALILYFKNLTYEECKAADAIPKAQDHLREEFNRIVDETAGEPRGIVYKVIIKNILPQ